MADESVVPVEETVEAQTPVEGQESTDTQTEPVVEKKEEEPPKKNHDTRRWERLMKERAEFKARAEFYEQQMQSKKESPASGRPARDQFPNDEDYVDALTTWKVNEKLGTVKQEIAQHQNQSKSQEQWVSKINQARTDYSDYDAVMEDAQDIAITPAVAEAIQSADYGADIAYYLAKNPSEAERINSLSPMASAREIGRIESYVEYERSQAKKVVPVSKAPSPIKPVKSSTAGSGTKSLESMTPAEYIAYRNKQGKRR